MGLRKLNDKPTSKADPKPAERIHCEAVVRNYQQEAEHTTTASRERTPETDMDDLTPARTVSTDLQTPPPSHKEFEDDASDLRFVPPVAAAPAPQAGPKIDEPSVAAANNSDSFMAALEALRATLRQPPVPAADSKADTPGEAPAPVPTPDTPVSMKALEIEDGPVTLVAPKANDPKNNDIEPASALERMPLPPPIEGPAPTPRPLYEDPLAKNSRRKSTPTPAPAVERETTSMDSAMQAVRNAVPGFRLTPPKSDTPTNGRERPLSDGIPKSVSEDMPKYTARAKMRICGRCGHETKLRNAKCEKCAHVDESLGILDAVIAGDLNRVEQVLLVRPNLITLRTSRHEWTLLHMAASGGNPKMVELLLSKGASVNATNRDGKTALHYAAGKGHLTIVKTLLAQHADPTILYNGRSALDLARKAGHHDVADAIRVLMPEGNPEE